MIWWIVGLLYVIAGSVVAAIRFDVSRDESLVPVSVLFWPLALGWTIGQVIAELRSR